LLMTITRRTLWSIIMDNRSRQKSSRSRIHGTETRGVAEVGGFCGKLGRGVVTIKQSEPSWGGGWASPRWPATARLCSSYVSANTPRTRTPSSADPHTITHKNGGIVHKRPNSRHLRCTLTVCQTPRHADGSHNRPVCVRTRLSL
jgi:hypothetical protein